MAHAQSRGGQDYEASKYVGWRTRKYDIMIVLIFFCWTITQSPPPPNISHIARHKIATTIS